LRGATPLLNRLCAFWRLAVHTQLLPVLESGEETLVGGQAVMEGVMMRTPHAFCTAVRRADGTLTTEQGILQRLSERRRIWKLPVLRGIGVLGQAMWLGIKALQFSTHVAIDGEQRDVAPAERLKIPAWVMWLNLGLSFVFFVAFYKFVPLLVTTRMAKAYPSLHGHILFNLVDGAIRLLLLIGFMWALSWMKDMHRLFEYHGGEHRVVFNYESGTEVTVANAQKFVTWHPRCGTSFLLVVMLLAIPIYAMLPFENFTAKLVSRVLLLPLVIGLSYEIIRFAARRRGSILATLTKPGLWLQRITTQPPSDEQTAVAIHALQGAMELERTHGGELVIA